MWVLQWCWRGVAQFTGEPVSVKVLVAALLARAVLAGRPWPLLDEPRTDSETETELRISIDTWLEKTGTGLILVTHKQAMFSLAGQFLKLTR